MDVAANVRALTGRKTRVVWAQQQQEHWDFVGLEHHFKLLGLDTDDGLGERVILGEIGSYTIPLITPNGDRVIYTDNKSMTVNIVNWDGSNRRELCPGCGLCVWRDPADRREWLYVRPEECPAWNSKSRPVRRILIDDPDIGVEVWNQSSVSRNWFQVSPDGAAAAVATPWPQCGLMTLPNGTFTEFDRGCWTCMAQDDSHRIWVFDGDHRHVKIYDTAGRQLAKVDIHQCPGVKGWEIYHPRWSNNVRYLTVTGPYSKDSPEPCTEELRGNWIGNGGKNVEIYIGRFNKGITAVEEWVKITDNDKADFYGDAWIQPDA